MFWPRTVFQAKGPLGDVDRLKKDTGTGDKCVLCSVTKITRAVRRNQLSLRETKRVSVPWIYHEPPGALSAESKPLNLSVGVEATPRSVGGCLELAVGRCQGDATTRALLTAYRGNLLMFALYLSSLRSQLRRDIAHG